jgi:hypothetical protein
VVLLVVPSPRIRVNNPLILLLGLQVMMRNLRTRPRPLPPRLRRLLPRHPAPVPPDNLLLVDLHRLLGQLPPALLADNRLLPPASLTLNNLHDSIELGFSPTLPTQYLGLFFFICLGFIRAFCDLFLYLTPLVSSLSPFISPLSGGSCMRCV